MARVAPAGNAAMIAHDPTAERFDLTACVVRALVLYSLAEFQSGHATTIRVTVDGTVFSVADDGRGHAIDRAVDGTPYMRFVYEHLEFPHASGVGAPVQLQGIGLSLVNALCSELIVTVRKADASLRLRFREGRLERSEPGSATANETGNTIAGTISPRLCPAPADGRLLEGWLLRVLAACPSLQLHFNGRRLQASRDGG